MSKLTKSQIQALKGIQLDACSTVEVFNESNAQRLIDKVSNYQGDDETPHIYYVEGEIGNTILRYFTHRYGIGELSLKQFLINNMDNTEVLD